MEYGTPEIDLIKARNIAKYIICISDVNISPGPFAFAYRAQYLRAKRKDG